MLRADNLTTFLCRLSRRSGSLNLLGPYGPVQVCTRIVLPLPLLSNGAIIAYMVQRLAAGWMFRGSFPGGCKKFSVFHTSPELHSGPTGPGGCFAEKNVWSYTPISRLWLHCMFRGYFYLYCHRLFLRLIIVWNLQIQFTLILCNFTTQTLQHHYCPLSKQTKPCEKEKLKIQSRGTG